MIIKFQGLQIRIESPAGSVREGVDKGGKPWRTTMSHDYGEILGSKGIDGDPVDVFIGHNKSAKFVYVVHQTTKDGNAIDEDKCFMGFNDAMDAKEAFYKNYDVPEFFWGPVEAIPVDVFKKKVMETKQEPSLIHASKMNTAIELHEKPLLIMKPRSLGLTSFYIKHSLTTPVAWWIKAQDHTGGPGIGEEVTVDGFQGRGVITKIEGNRITVRFRSGLYISRASNFVHKMSENTVNQMWRR